MSFRSECYCVLMLKTLGSHLRSHCLLVNKALLTAQAVGCAG